MVVLPRDGEIKRMDRVIIDGKKATVIDFKSGQPKSQDNKQVKEYSDLLNEMGYEVDAFLLYLNTKQVLEVN